MLFICSIVVYYLIICILQEKSDIPATLLHLNKFKNPSPDGETVENEESISDADLDNIVGVGDSSELEVWLFVVCPALRYICECKMNVKNIIPDFEVLVHLGNGSS